MDFPNYFADAESNFDDADFILFGIPFDKTSSFRHGSEKAPSAIRTASWNFETFNLRTGTDLKNLNFHDYGDLDVKTLNSIEMINNVKDFSLKLQEKKKFPIAIGGEHSISTGIVQSFPKDTAVLSLDAHLDFRQIYENNIYNHACVLRRISEHVKIRNIAAIGIRSAEFEEYEEANRLNLFFRDIFTIKKRGFSNVLKETKDYLKDMNIYFTLDIDVLDPAYAPGTSTPEPFGLDPFDILNCIDIFAPLLVGFDLVEVSPAYDHGETALLAAKIIRHVIDRVGQYKYTKK